MSESELKIQVLADRSVMLPHPCPVIVFDRDIGQRCLDQFGVGGNSRSLLRFSNQSGRQSATNQTGSRTR